MKWVSLERRSAVRYALELTVSCGLFRGGRMLPAKSGKTRNLSSKGILFNSEQLYETGSSLWMSIIWPATRDDAEVELIILGHTVRSDVNGTALAIDRYAFHSSESPGSPTVRTSTTVL